MRILIISDIHANFSALEAILTDSSSFDAVWCLGDLVGYGPDPNECVACIRHMPNLKCIIGNHDAAALMRIDADTFNPEARMALHWTQKNLCDASKEFLRGLPELIQNENVTLAHGSPRHPIWEYLLDTHTAGQNFMHFTTFYCFVGHTHLPAIFSIEDEGQGTQLTIPEPDTRLQLIPRAIFNPGSVGQPRDRDPRAAYAIYNDETHEVDYRRVAYDIAAVQARMMDAGLPQRHIQRLVSGW